MTAREIWDRYRQEATLDVETPAEIALQKVAFISGFMTACEMIVSGQQHVLDVRLAGEMSDLLDEGGRDLDLAANHRSEIVASEN